MITFIGNYFGVTTTACASCQLTVVTQLEDAGLEEREVIVIEVRQVLDPEVADDGIFADNDVQNELIDFDSSHVDLEPEVIREL